MLQQGQQGRHLPSERRASLAGRFAQVRGTRIALRARLHHEHARRKANATATAAAAAGQRRLQQDASPEAALRPLLDALQSAINAGSFQLAGQGEASIPDADATYGAADDDTGFPLRLLEDDAEADAPLSLADAAADAVEDAPAADCVVIVQVRGYGMCGGGVC